METRKTNLGVEYELEAYETGISSVKVLAYFQPTIEFNEFEIKGLTDEQVGLAREKEDISTIPDTQLSEAQQYINEQAIMYISMELAKLMGEGKITNFKLGCVDVIMASVLTIKSEWHSKKGLTQIEELIKQIRYSK